MVAQFCYMKRYSEEEKTEILSKYEKSGLSLFRFCRQEKLNYQTVARWAGVESKKRMTPVELVEVELSGESHHGQVSGEQRVVRLPQGMEVIFEGGEDIAEIARFCREVVGC